MKKFHSVSELFEYYIPEYRKKILPPLAENPRLVDEMLVKCLIDRLRRELKAEREEG